jgi:hypothetical protein
MAEKDFGFPRGVPLIDLKRESDSGGDNSGQVNDEWSDTFLRWHNLVITVQDSGTTEQRPTTGLFLGRQYFDTDLGLPVFLKSVRPNVWVTGSSRSFGPTADRPIIDLFTGRMFFDTDLGMPVFLESIDPIVWVNSSGTTGSGMSYASLFFDEGESRVNVSISRVYYPMIDAATQGISNGITLDLVTDKMIIETTGHYHFSLSISAEIGLNGTGTLYYQLRTVNTDGEPGPAIPGTTISTYAVGNERSNNKSMNAIINLNAGDVIGFYAYKEGSSGMSVKPKNLNFTLVQI